MAHPNISASSSSPSPAQSERLSSKFHRKSKFLMKSNINVEVESLGTNATNPESSAPSPLSHQKSPSELTVPVSGSDINPITQPTQPTPGVVLHTTTEKINLQAAKDLQKSKPAAASSTPLSPVNQSPRTPLMEIIPPPPSHRLQVKTPLESTTGVASSNNNFPERQPLTEIQQHTPLTESQIDDAKNLVLDLLGWGVDPEYLVTSGVHPELIYRIFTDLNLRLPRNLMLFEDG